MAIDLSLENRVALVTGSSSGIGQQIAVTFATRGAQVLITGLDAEGCERTQELIRDNGGRCHVYPGDLSEFEFLGKLVSECRERLGPVDILINNAATLTVETTETVTPGSWDRQVSVNLRAPLFLAQLCLSDLRRSASARIVNIGSAGAVTSHDNKPVYDMTKAGLEALTRCLAAVHATDNILVNCLRLGAIANEPSQLVENEVYRERISSIPLRRLGTTQEVADLVAFLCSKRATYLTGSVITVDGGRGSVLPPGTI